MGGTIETFDWTPEIRIKATAGIQTCLAGSGIHLGLTDMQLYEIISTGLCAYHLVSLKTMQELPPERVWNDFIFADFSLDQEKITAIAEDLMLFIETHYYQRAMRPEVPGVLEALKKLGLKIGLISNVNSQSQVPSNLEKYGIRQYFDPIVLSSQYGRRKPDPAIFHHAARLAAVPTGDCVYVGDRIARDIVGARKAGFGLAIQIINDFDHGEEDHGAEPDGVIHEMTELLEILKANNNDYNVEVDPDRPICALLFDAGDILYHRPDRGKHLRIFLEGLGLTNQAPPAQEVNALKQEAYTGQITLDQHRHALLRLYGLTDPAQIEQGNQMMDLDDNNIQFFRGVPETLKKLKKIGFRLGIITDTAIPLNVKLSWFESGGFGHVWDSIISSKEMGIQKPSPRMYQAALQQMGVRVDQAAFIGHSPEELEGARALGLKTIAFNYGESAQADYYVDKFKDLLTIPLICTDGSRK